MGKYAKDIRSQQEIQHQKQIIQNYSARNFQIFNKLIEQQKNIQQLNLDNEYQIPQKIYLSGNRFVLITDNLKEKNQTFITSNVIFTIHGIPDSHQSFKLLQSSFPLNYCRWINFCIPGLDQFDERRGQFDSNFEESMNLVYDLLQKLQIEKVVIIVHSFGGVIGKCFSYKYPQKVKALIQLASIPLYEWAAYQQSIFYIKNHLLPDLYSQINIKTLNDDNFRAQIQQKLTQFQQQIKQLPKEQQKAFVLVNMLSIYDIIVFLKYELEGLDFAIEIMKQIDNKIPRFFAYNDKDLFISPEIIEDEIWKVIQSSQVTFENKNTLGLELDKNNFQSNFVFQFQNATHNLQTTRPQELSALIQAFLSIIDNQEQTKNQKL